MMTENQEDILNKLDNGASLYEYSNQLVESSFYLEYWENDDRKKLILKNSDIKYLLKHKHIKYVGKSVYNTSLKIYERSKSHE